MEPLKIYDYLTLARRRLFDWVRPLSAEDYAREFQAGQRSLGQVLTHTMISEWAYLQRIQRRVVPPYDQWPFQDETPPPFAVLEPAWTHQSAGARQALGVVRDWATEFDYTFKNDDGRLMIITASPSDIFTQLVLHEVHHRAQAMMLLRRLGVALDDIDYNALMYKRRPAAGP